MSADDRPSELKPARPDVDRLEGRPAYMPKIPWGWLLLGTLIISGVGSVVAYRRQARIDGLREQMLTVHQDRLSELSQRYGSFQEKLESWVMAAHAAGEPETFIDPRLRIAELRSRPGLYLRVPADFAGDSESIAGAAWSMEPDSITRCLGLAPMSVRGLYRKGEFLTSAWVENLRQEEELMKLRVLDDQLGRHLQVDVPVLATMMSAQWFMLVIQQGENRRDAPVDVYLWDLRTDAQLLRVRLQGRGLLVPVRLRVNGAPTRGGHPRVASGGAHDCSIASQLRGLSGDRGVEFESADQVVERALEVEAAAAAAAAEAASSEEAEPSGDDSEVEPSSDDSQADATQADDEGEDSVMEPSGGESEAPR